MDTQTKPITNRDNLIDLYDLRARVEWLRKDLEGFEEPGGCEYDEERDELETLEALLNECSDAVLNHPHILVSDYYIEEFMENRAYESGLIDRDSPLADFVDWERWAEREKGSAEEVIFDGVTYWAL
jgi:hypothetical protein